MDFDAYPITIALIAANVIFSLIGFSSPALMQRTIGWPYYEKRNGQYYRILTSGFLHADFIHLFFNMFTLFFFGRILEMTLVGYGLGGSISYLALYFSSLIIADIPSLLKHSNDPNYRSLGASGAVSAVVFGVILFNPWSSIYLYGALKISAALYAVLYVVYCVYMGRQNRDNVNHDAHLWGAVYGLAFMIILVAVLQPDLFEGIVNALKDPSIFGR